MKDNENKTADTAERNPDVKMDFSVEATGKDAEEEKRQRRSERCKDTIIVSVLACLVSVVLNCFLAFLVSLAVCCIAAVIWYSSVLNGYKEGFGRFPRWWGGL